MKLYKGTGCQVKLIGTLNEIPMLNMDNQGDFFTTINININTPHNVTAKQYNIIVLKEAALRIRQYGFPGLYLLIEGFLSSEKNIKIIAEKIIFLDNFGPNESNMQINAHSYAQSTSCFAIAGSLRAN